VCIFLLSIVFMGSVASACALAVGLVLFELYLTALLPLLSLELSPLTLCNLVVSLAVVVDLSVSSLCVRAVTLRTSGESSAKQRDDAESDDAEAGRGKAGHMKHWYPSMAEAISKSAFTSALGLVPLAFAKSPMVSVLYLRLFACAIGLGWVFAILVIPTLAALMSRARMGAKK
jgi:multidrug efflux pump subunit AcrB